MVKLISIVAMGTNNVIGKSAENEMPWRLGNYAKDPFYSKIFRKADMARFKEITGDNPVIMGRNTWYSIPEKFRPLMGRENIVISKTVPEEKGVKVYSSFEEAIKYLYQFEKAVFMGGRSIYEAALPLIDVLEVSRINHAFEGDVKFPLIPETLELQNPKKAEYDLRNNGFAFETYVRK